MHHKTVAVEESRGKGGETFSNIKRERRERRVSHNQAQNI
jgi:hypothetical protein